MIAPSLGMLNWHWNLLECKLESFLTLLYAQVHQINFAEMTEIIVYIILHEKLLLAHFLQSINNSAYIYPLINFIKGKVIRHDKAEKCSTKGFLGSI